MKFLNRKYFNNKGFTLTEIMVGAALMGVVSLASYSLIKNSKNADVQFDKKTDSTLFLSSFGQYILSENGCGEFAGDTPTLVYQAKTFQFYNGYGGDATVGANHVLKTDHMEIESLQYRFKEDSNIVGKRIMGIMKRQQVLQVRLRIRMSPKGLKLDPATNQIKEKYFEVPVLTNNLNVIESCNINLSQAEICDTLNLIYVPATKSCGPQPGATSCNVRGSYATISCSPGGYGCINSFGGTGFNYFTGGPNCGPGETTHRSGFRRSSYVVGCGKKCRVRIYRNETYYTCMICP